METAVIKNFAAARKASISFWASLFRWSLDPSFRNRIPRGGSEDTKFSNNSTEDGVIVAYKVTVLKMRQRHSPFLLVWRLLFMPRWGGAL